MDREHSNISDLWALVSDEANRAILTWFGGGIVVVASGTWAVIKFYAARHSSTPMSLNITNPISIGEGSVISGIIAGGSVSIDKFIQTNTTELVNILTLRAKIINNELPKFYHYAKVQNYLKEFNDLHAKHIQALNNANLSLAHEILLEIHRLSFELEREEFWTSDHAVRYSIKYSLRRDAFERGHMIDAYVVGDMRCYSKFYPSEIRLFKTDDVVVHKTRDGKFTFDHKPVDELTSKNRVAKLYNLVIQSFYDNKALKSD